MLLAAPPLLRRCRRFLSGSPAPDGGHPLREQARRFTTAQTLVRGFYAFLLYQSVAQFTTLGDLVGRHVYAPLWPVAWLSPTHGPTAVRALLAFSTATCVLGAFFAEWRATRIIVLVGMLEYVALKNSFGKIGHSLHLLVIVAGVLVMLPSGWARAASLVSRRLRQETLLVVWLAQAVILLSYTMSGLSKLLGAAYQIATNQPNVFLPGAFGAHVAERLVQTGSHSTLGDWIVHHPYLTWPLMPSAVVFETFAFLVAFRPSLGRPVAALLILFHIGTYFTMTITFPANCLLLALFFFASPFEPTKPSWQNVLSNVPLAHKARTFLPAGRKRASD